MFKLLYSLLTPLFAVGVNNPCVQPIQQNPIQLECSNPYGGGIAKKQEPVRNNNQADNLAYIQTLYDTGQAYSYGIDVIQNQEIAITYYCQAAQLGHPQAQYEMGLAFFQGTVVHKSLKKCIKWYQSAANLGCSQAQYELGNIYFEQGDHTGKKRENDAIHLYHQAAGLGHTEALYKLAHWYLNGIIVEKNLEIAVNFYKQAAEKDHIESQYQLGWCYLNGIGMPSDPSNQKMAVFWYKKAAQQDHAQAQYELGTCYFQSIGVPADAKNLEIALFLYKKAAQQDHAQAQYELATCYFHSIGVPADPKNRETALFWYKKAAQQWHCDALIVLGNYYYDDTYGAKNINQAQEFYWKAGLQGDTRVADKIADYHPGNWPKEDLLVWKEKAEKCEVTGKILEIFVEIMQDSNAQTVLGLMRMDQAKSRQEKNAAWSLIEKGAAKLNTYAQMMLAGRYKDTDTHKHFCYLVKAGNGGDPQAQRSVGLLYQVKAGDPQAQWSIGLSSKEHRANPDSVLEQAKEWLRKSAKQGFCLGMRDLASFLNCEDIQLGTWKQFYQRDIKKIMFGDNLGERWDHKCQNDILKLSQLNNHQRLQYKSFVFLGNITPLDLEHMHQALNEREGKKVQQRELEEACNWPCTLDTLYFSDINFTFSDMLNFFKSDADVNMLIIGLNSEINACVDQTIAQNLGNNEFHRSEVSNVHLKEMMCFDLFKLPKVLVLPLDTNLFTLEQQRTVNQFFVLLKNVCAKYMCKKTPEEEGIIKQVSNMKVLWE